MADMSERAGRNPTWRFRGTFRSYQQRVLDQVSELGDDQQLHVVAAPGSGKTILGLELAGRRGQRVLAVSPTLAIRDQWISRLTESFEILGPDTSVSTDLREPGFLTTTTYQALFHAVSSNEGENEPGSTRSSASDVSSLAHALAGVGTVILDEAHHLRTAWHRVLTDLLDELRSINPDLHTIALTATPPYDTGVSEWQRYIDLCGEIDMEISVPELVATGDLAPHQDFVLVGSPTAEEYAQIDRLREGIYQVIDTIAGDRLPDHPAPAGSDPASAAPALQALVQSPIMTTPEEVLDECFDDEEGLAGFLLLLDAWRIERPAPIDALFAPGGHLGSHSAGLRFIIAHPHLFEAGFEARVRDELDRRGLLKRGHLVDLVDDSTRKILANSLGKLTATTQVITHEARTLGPAARILVLSDYIRGDHLRFVGTSEPLPAVGVVPAFETLRRSLAEPANNEVSATQSIGVLTGSLVIVPTAIISALQEYRDANGNNVSVTANELPGCPEYSRLSLTDTSTAVSVLTQAFSDGLLTIVFGTAALLGEGWDMPGLNTLVLDSTIKATMMANQMRGRAIRIDPATPDKVANIWHVTCAEHGNTPFADSVGLVQLAHRMENFVGPRASEPFIQNGLTRCASHDSAWNETSPDRLNDDNLRRATDRDLTRRLWREALDRNLVSGTHGLNLHVENELRMPPPVTVLSGFDYVMWLLLGALLVLAMYLIEAGTVHPVFLIALAIVGAGILALSLVRMRTRRTLLNARWRVTAQANALLTTLRHLGFVSSPATVTTSETSTPGLISVGLNGARPREQEIFSAAIGQMCGPVKDPRYLLAPRRGPRIGSTLLVMSVPQIIGTRREQVDVLVNALESHGLATHAHYTRNSEGRKLLLLARKAALTNIATGFSTTASTLAPPHR